MDLQSEQELRDRIRRLEQQVAFLLDHFGLTERARDPQGAQDKLRNELLSLKRAGQIITAIKIYREATGLGLAEAKAYVDGLQ